MEGLEKKDLQAKRDKIVADIADYETQEKTNSGLIHVATAEKAKLKADIIKAKNVLATIDQLIGECKELKVGATIPLGH